MFGIHDLKLGKNINKNQNRLIPRCNGNGWILARQKLFCERIDLYRRIILRLKIFKIALG